jgi:undecaprenyl pyrophosphate phosphatase UppP
MDDDRPSHSYFSVEGELTLVFEDGTEHHLKNPGDVVIQRGTMHAWRYVYHTRLTMDGHTAHTINRNRGKVWCRWTTVHVAALPVVINGEPLADYVEDMNL